MAASVYKILEELQLHHTHLADVCRPFFTIPIVDQYVVMHAQIPRPAVPMWKPGVVTTTFETGNRLVYAHADVFAVDECILDVVPHLRQGLSRRFAAVARPTWLSYFGEWIPHDYAFRKKIYSGPLDQYMRDFAIAAVYRGPHQVFVQSPLINVYIPSQADLQAHATSTLILLDSVDPNPDWSECFEQIRQSLNTATAAAQRTADNRLASIDAKFEALDRDTDEYKHLDREHTSNSAKQKETIVACGRLTDACAVWVDPGVQLRGQPTAVIHAAMALPTL